MERAVGGERREGTRRRKTTATRTVDARDADAANGGEFVQLAASLNRCVAFNPKQWRHVLDKSAVMLNHRKSDVIKPSTSKYAKSTRPVSTEEDVREKRDVFPPLSVAQYLNQPELVRELLKEEEEQSEEGGAVEVDEEEQENEDDADAETLDRVESNEWITEDDGDGRKKTPPLVLPLLTTISPRTRRGLAKLPPPNEVEMREISNLERVVDDSDDFRDFYQEMQVVQARQRKRALPSSLATLSRSTSVPTVIKRNGKRNHGHNRTHKNKKANVTVSTAKGPVLSTEEKIRLLEIEIKRMVPLETIYAVGLGKFASPAQQRAAEVLHHVSIRLKFQLLYQGMCRWKECVAAMLEQEQENSSIALQCWWRQMSARKELAALKSMRREVQRRQQELLALLATRQNQAASRITRCVRYYCEKNRHKRLAAQQKAAIQIQNFWRKLYTQWAALRREIARQQRHKAAICIQKHGRRVIAQRKRCLLRKIVNVENRRRLKAQEVYDRRTAMKVLGAVLTIQEAFRSWQQQRILVLRRRRAAFEKDREKILKVQAHYRGQQARKWTNKHREDVHRAVTVLQCSWRCYFAKKQYQLRKDQARAQREQLRKDIQENRRSNALGQLQAKLGQFPRLKGTNAGIPSREIQAATKLQARWKGVKLRQRLRCEKAKETGKQRRAVNRKRRLAAVCIQKRIRGIRGRAHAWHIVEKRSAERIQRVWRGYKTRIQLLKSRAAIAVIKKIQACWRSRHSAETLRFRARNALIIQRAARKFIGRKIISAIARRRQFLAEEAAVGKAFVDRTRSRTKDELLLQSFVFTSLQPADDKKQKQKILEKKGGENPTHVDRPLYVVDLEKKSWERKGYDGVWQEIFRNASGNLAEMDNSHFTRFLKALPHGFIHKTQFPVQNADVIFAKMKEPKAKAISFPRFNKAVLMLLREKFEEGNAGKETSKRSEAAESEGDHERFLRFINRFVLPSTIQNGKYRKMLDNHCNKRLLWSAAVLRRFADRIATKKRHDQFVVIFKEQQRLNHLSKCASTVQKAYRCYKFRLQLKHMLASMFVEFVDYSGRSVKFQHISSGKYLSKRPIFLKGVACGKIVPLPYPGEEFRAFCERHEDSTQLSDAKVPAEVYCVECEDAMCKICFSRDHTVRKAFQSHQARRIQKCSHCNLETATRECLQCGNGKVPYCDSCFPHVHRQLLKQSKQDQRSKPASNSVISNAVQADEKLHKFQALVVMCVECSDRVAQWSCETCLDFFCKRCMSSYHAKGQRQHHRYHRLNYFSVLRQKAQEKRDADNLKELEKKRKQREAEKRLQEAELRRQNLATTKIQAVIRSFVARRKGKAYMKLVRQTQAARAQRLKDERVRTSIAYKVKAVFGVSPALKSDTAQETEARRQRFENIKRTLFLQRLPLDPSNPVTRHWSTRHKARALKATRTWCDYDAQVKIKRGEWENCVGSIVSTQNMMLTGKVLVFIPLANRSVVLRWEDIQPFDQEMLRRPYEPPQQVAVNLSRDFHAKISQVLDAGARRAQLLYLQTLEFNDIAQYAWVAEYDKLQQKEEYWNVVLNRRVAEPPKAMEQIERMEQDQREKLEKRVALARSKLIALLHPFQPKNKAKLALRRSAIVFIPSGLVAPESNTSVATLRREMEAIDCARFWHDKVVPDRRFGGKKARKFLSICDPSVSWAVAKIFYWMDLHESGGFESHAKKLLGMAEDKQMYVANAVAEKLAISGETEASRDKLLQLLQLDESTLQLLVSKDHQQAASEDAH